MSRPMSPSDFRHRRYFPGTHGNPFDVVLRAARIIQGLPLPVFAVLLAGLALLAARGQWPLAGGLFAFYLGDWALVAALPRAQKSFGPAKPPTLLLALLRAPFALLPIPLALAAQAVGTGLVVYGFWIEPGRVVLTRQSLHSPKWKPGAPPLRILHLGDLHVERVTDRERQVVALARETAPDLILFSGDFLSLSNVYDPVAWEAVRAVLRQLAAPLGVYVVAGSPPVDEPEVVPQLLRDLPLRWLQDEKVTLNHHGQTFDLIGLTCTHKPFEEAPRLAALVDHDPQRFKLLLYHTPDLAPEAAKLGLDLQLSGHTHGGQVRLPILGALYSGSLYGKRFEAGRRQVGGLTLYVTRGIGLEGQGAPRVRFLCPPEVIVWEISG
jgi:predicted MPP superfamily phosphohydrolase